MAELDLPQIMARVNILKEGASVKAHHRRMPQYWRVVNGTLPADLPEHMLKGQVIEMPSPRGNRVKRQLIAETAAYPVYVTVSAENPDGSITQVLKDKADTVERWDTLQRDRLDAGKRVSNQVRDHQLASAWCVMLLHCGEDEENPWRVEVPNPLTCFPPIEHGGAYRPKYLAREFKMLVRDAKKAYEGKRYANGRKLKYDKGLRWEPLAPGRPESNGIDSAEGFNGAKEPGFAEELSFVVLYTDDYTYHVCKDAEGDGGEVVWCAKNITGGVPAVVVPGDTNAIGGDGEEMLPIMYEVLTILRSKNLCRALIMTVAAADRPEMIINCTPEQLVAMREKGMAVPANDAELRAGGPRMLAISGEPTGWIAAPNDALYKIDEQLGVELEQAANALVPSTDTLLASASTAEAWHSVTGTQNRQQTPMLQHLDWAWAEILRMIHCSLQEYGDEYTLTASVDMPRKHGSKATQIKGGTSHKLSASDLDFKFNVTVASTQETEEQLQRRKEQAWIDLQRGGISWEQYLAVSYPDTDSQVEELLFDSALRILEQANLTFLATAYQGKLLTRAGIFVPMGAETLQPMAPMAQLPAGGGQQQPQGWQPAPEGAAVGGATSF